MGRPKSRRRNQQENERRRQEAEQRNAQRQARSDEEQLRLLESRPGSAEREKEKLRERIAKNKPRGK